MDSSMMNGTPDMGGDSNMTGAMPDMGGEMEDPSMMGGTPDMGGDPTAMSNNDGATSPFDTNFDAGVEADEETDPKRFIQQLTGKLSTTLNSYNNENGEPDSGLCKYVGKMIIKQAAKGLDDSAKKELIAAINSVDSESDDMDSNDGDEEDNIDNDETEMLQDNNGTQEQMLEYVITKKQLIKLSENVNPNLDEPEKRVGSVNKKQKQNTTFSGKKLN